MNIFYLSGNPELCAHWAVDKHVVKMVVEAAQLLSTAHRVLDGKQTTINVLDKNGKPRNKRVWKLDDARDKILYSATHVNHPCAQWVRESSGNYNWTWCYLSEHCDEYTHRYGKTHKVKVDGLLGMLAATPINIPIGPMTLSPSCMDTKYIISNDPTVNYKNYYKHGKAHLHSWKNREAPEWIKEA